MINSQTCRISDLPPRSQTHPRIPQGIGLSSGSGAAGEPVAVGAWGSAARVTHAGTATLSARRTEVDHDERA
jgi:hypothetical protein